MNKEYNEVYDQLKAPEEWKTAIKAQMHQAVEEETAEKEQKLNEAYKLLEVPASRKAIKKKNPILKWAMPIAGLAAAAVLFLTIMQPASTTGPVYITAMEEGRYYETVLLEDSTLKFVDKGEQLFLGGSQLGVIGMETPAESEAENDKANTHTVGQGTITLLVTDELVNDGDRGSVSFIGDRSVYLSMETVSGKQEYTASYKKNDTYYLMKSENVTQKEFIDFLYNEVTKEN